jgi:hypothetical protein
MLFSLILTRRGPYRSMMNLCPTSGQSGGLGSSEMLLEPENCDRKGTTRFGHRLSLTCILKNAVLSRSQASESKTTKGYSKQLIYAQSRRLCELQPVSSGINKNMSTFLKAMFSVKSHFAIQKASRQPMPTVNGAASSIASMKGG